MKNLLIKRSSKTTKNELKNKKDGFLRMLLGTLTASLLGKILVGKLKIPGWGVKRAGKRQNRAG